MASSKSAAKSKKRIDVERNRWYLALIDYNLDGPIYFELSKSPTFVGFTESCQWRLYEDVPFGKKNIGSYAPTRYFRMCFENELWKVQGYAGNVKLVKTTEIKRQEQDYAFLEDGSAFRIVFARGQQYYDFVLCEKKPKEVNEPPNSSLTSFPKESLKIVASHMPPSTFFRSLALVSRGVFCEKKHIAWDKISLPNSIEAVRICRTVTAAAVKELEVDCGLRKNSENRFCLFSSEDKDFHNDPNEYKTVLAGKNIRKLVVHGDKFFEIFKEMPKNLTEIDFTDESIDSSKLEGVVFPSSIEKVTARGLKDGSALSLFPNLRRLVLTKLPSFQTWEDAPAQCLEKLTHLAASVKEDGCSLTSKLKNLRFLGLEMSCCEVAEWVSLIGVVLYSVETLELGWDNFCLECRGPEGKRYAQYLTSIAAAVPNVKNLLLTTTFVNDQNVSEVVGLFKNLKTARIKRLNFPGQPDLTLAGLLNTLESRPNLKYMRIETYGVRTMEMECATFPREAMWGSPEPVYLPEAFNSWEEEMSALGKEEVERVRRGFKI